MTFRTTWNLPISGNKSEDLNENKATHIMSIKKYIGS